MEREGLIYGGNRFPRKILKSLPGQTIRTGSGTSVTEAVTGEDESDAEEIVSIKRACSFVLNSLPNSGSVF